MLANIVCGSKYLTNIFPEKSLIRDLISVVESKTQRIEKSSNYFLCNGRRIAEDAALEDGKTYHIVPRLPGGKGGFGSMLRAIGAQIEKTTSREACRDLSGRRMRDINNEKKLKEWLGKEADREKEREQRRQERLTKQQHQPQHKFEDAEYQEQKAKIQDNLQDAISKGLKRAHGKGKQSAVEAKKMKKNGLPSSSKAEWLGVDLDTDESSSSSDNEANPGVLQDESSCSSRDGREANASSSYEKTCNDGDEGPSHSRSVYVSQLSPTHSSASTDDPHTSSNLDLKDVSQDSISSETSAADSGLEPSKVSAAASSDNSTEETVPVIIKPTLSSVNGVAAV